MDRLADVARRIDPAWIAALACVIVAAGLAYWLWPQKTATTQPDITTTRPDVTISTPVEPLPLPVKKDAKWTTDLLLYDIDQLVSRGKLSAAPTLRELQRAGWPPRDLQGGIVIPLHKLIVLTKLPPDAPLALDDQRIRRLLVDGLQAYGVISVPLDYRFQSAPFEYLRALGDGAQNFLNSGGFTDIALPRLERIEKMKGFFGTSLPEPVPGFDADELVDRAFHIEMARNDPALKGFADASWVQPVPPAIKSAYPLLRPLAAIVPLLMLALWFWRWAGYRRLYVRQPHGLRDDPLDHSLVVSAPGDILKNRTDKAWMAGIARSLNVRQHVAFLAIDPESTVRATIAEGGLFKPVAGAITSSPAYLVFIEAKNGFDQEAKRLEGLYLRLLDAGIAIMRYVYFDSPALLHANWDAPAETIDDIAAQHGDRRLIILGEGRGYLKPLSLKPEPWASALMQWPDRALLTPKPIDEWGAEDFAIARELNLPLGRATIEGLAALAELMGLTGRAPLTRAYGFSSGRDIRPLPALIRTRTYFWTSDSDPDEGENEASEWLRLESALRDYLDTPGLMWLAALAIYPALQWDLTIYLGRKLELGGQEFYAEPRLAALTRLPWLREGHMPEWLRRRLLPLLPQHTRLKAIELIWAIMKPDETGRSAALVKPKNSGTVSYRGRRPATDPFFVSTVTDGDGFPLPSNMRPSLVSQVKDFIRLQWDKLAVAAVISVVGWRVSPRLDATLGPGSYMPLTLLILIPVTGLLITRLADDRIAALVAGWRAGLPRAAMRSTLGRNWQRLRNRFAQWINPPPSRAEEKRTESVIYVSRFKPYRLTSGSLEDALKARGFGVMENIDESEAPESIAAADAFVVVSTLSGFSPRMERELREALSKNVPVYVARFGYDKLPEFVESLRLPVTNIGGADLSLDDVAIDDLARLLRQTRSAAA